MKIEVYKTDLFNIRTVLPCGSNIPRVTIEVNRSLNVATPLAQSIEKWQTIVDFLKNNSQYFSMFFEDGGPRTCALCCAHFENNCLNCPVKDAGYPYCEGTPYTKFSNSFDTDDLLSAAEAEVEFLKSLRRTPCALYELDGE